MSGHGMSYMSSPSIIANDTESSTASLSVPRLSFDLTSSAESTTQLSSLMNGMATAGVHDFSKRPTSSMQVPPTSLASSTLSDLSLAAFVESLYTLEIAPSDGLTQSMLDGQTSLNESKVLRDDVSDSSLSSSYPISNDVVPMKLSEPGRDQTEYAKSAFLGDQLAFSVPSDMRWWNTALSLPLPMEKNFSTSSPQVNTFPSQSNHDSKPLAFDTGLDPSLSSTCEPVSAASCCSKSRSATLGSAPTTHMGVPTPAGGSSCCTSFSNTSFIHPVSDHLFHKSSTERLKRPSSPEKVHCVPSPDGSRCSCQCDSGLAFLSLERSIRKGIQTSPENDSEQSPENKALLSLVFTLSMSQSVSKQCKCSADCPTCKKSPSYKSSAAMLITTALQIYTRALQLFREMLASSGSRSCSCSCSQGQSICACNSPQIRSNAGLSTSMPPNASMATTSSSAPSLLSSTSSPMEVRIGDYTPSPQNTRKIALYALKLELIDLERALARVQNAAMHPLQVSHAVNAMKHASDEASHSCCVSKAHPDSEDGAQTANLHLNPVDQLVIRKLHEQLNEVLHAVERMELSSE